MVLEIRNPLDAVEEITALSRPARAEDLSLAVLNTTGIVTNDYIIIGEFGGEQSELRLVSTVPDLSTLTNTAAVGFSHGPGTIISVISYNQVEISVRPSPTTAWSVLDTINLDVDEEFTRYNHGAGATTDEYRFRFYNQVTAIYSEYSAVRRGSGAATDEVGPLVDYVLGQVSDPQAKFTTREQVIQHLEMARQDVKAQLRQASAEYDVHTIEIPTKNFKHEYTLPDDFAEIQEVRDANHEVVPPTKEDQTFGGRPGYELRGLDTLYFNNIPTPTSEATQIEVTNNAYNEDGTWVASLDATNVTTDLDEYKTGHGSVNFDVSVSLDSGNVAALTNATLTAIDATNYATATWRLWVYLPDATDITSLTLRWGSDATNYWSLTTTHDYKLNALHDGWNLVDFPWGDATKTLSPTYTISYLQLRLTYNARQGNDTDFRLDTIRLAQSYAANDVYEVRYLAVEAPLRGEMETTGLPKGYALLLCLYAMGMIELRKEGRQTIADRYLQLYDRQKKRFIFQAAKRTRRTIGLSLDRPRHY